MNQTHPVKLSIVIPTLNEAANIGRLLQSLSGLLSHSLLTSVEVLIVDGGSQDDTVQIADRHGGRCISAKRGRAVQMNAGWQASSGEMILFLHADSGVTPAWLEGLTAVCCMDDDSPRWGRFDVRINDRSVAFRLIESLINLRSRITGISTGDQAQFVSRACLEQIGGVPQQALMEDVELSKRLKILCKPLNRKEKIITSARRWRNGGIIRTIVQMWRLRWAYFLGASPESLAARYRHER